MTTWPAHVPCAHAAEHHRVTPTVTGHQHVVCAACGAAWVRAPRRGE